MGFGSFSEGADPPYTTLATGPNFGVHFKGRNWFTFTKRRILGPDTVTSIEYITDIQFIDNQNLGRIFSPPDISSPYFLIVGKPLSIKTDTTVAIPASVFGAAISTRSTVREIANQVDSSGRFSYLAAEASTVAEDGHVISSTFTNYGVPDPYGNVSSIKSTKYLVKSGGGSSVASTTTISRTIENDTSSWLLGQVTRESITETVGNASTTRTTAYGYGPQGDLEDVIREPDGWVAVTSTGPDGASNPYLKTWSVPDSYGNPRWIGEVDNPSAVSGARMVTFTAWDESHIFPAGITDKMGYPMTLSFAAGNGQPAMISDGNGSVAARRYDSFGRLITASSNGDESLYFYVADSPTSGQSGQAIPVWGAIQMISFTNQPFQGGRDVGPSDLYRTLWDLFSVRERINLSMGQHLRHLVSHDFVGCFRALRQEVASERHGPHNDGDGSRA